LNKGIAPLDPNTPVGSFRVLFGDVSYVPLNPPEEGYGDYRELSDVEIEGFISAASGSIYRGIATYYVQLAGQAAKVAESVKDFDLALDDTKRPAALLELAKYYFGLADNEDTGAEDAFQIVPTGKRGDFIPEGTIPQYGRRYVIQAYGGDRVF
jgi:hypothetical protein